jgi:ribose transport system permease protein
VSSTALVPLFRRVIQSEHLILIGCAFCFGLLALWVPGFASWSNGRTLLAYLLPILAASVGLTLVLLSGGIDLSITAIIALASVVGGRLMSREEGWLGGSAWAVPAGLAGMLGIGMLLGALNGLNVAALRLPPFIATLTLMMFGGGFAVWTTQSRKIFGLPAGFTVLARNLWLELLIVATSVGAAHWLLSRTLYGRWLQAVGHNRKTAFVSGVPVGRVIFATYVISGLFAGLSSILFTASLETGDPEMARTGLLDIVGATVLGGTSLFGGKGKVLWTIYGVLFLALIDNGLNLLGTTFFVVIMIKGMVIMVAAGLDSLRNKLLGPGA